MPTLRRLLTVGPHGRRRVDHSHDADSEAQRAVDALVAVGRRDHEERRLLHPGQDPAAHGDGQHGRVQQQDLTCGSRPGTSRGVLSSDDSSATCLRSTR